MLDKQLVNLSKDTIVYGLSGAIQKSISFLILPFLTSKLAPKDFGIFALITLAASFLVGLFNLGTSNSLYIMYHKESDLLAKEHLIWTNFFLNLMVALFLLPILFFLTALLNDILFSTGDYSELLFLAFTTLAIWTLCEPFMSYLRLENRVYTYVFFMIFTSSLIAFFSFYFVIVMNLGVEGLIFAGLISKSLVLLLMLLVVSRKIKFGVLFLKLKSLVRIGIPSIFGLFAFICIDYSDRKIIDIFLGLDLVGLYSMAYSFGSVALLITSAFSIAWSPFFISFVNKVEEAKIIFPKILYYYLSLICMISILFFGLSKDLMEFLTDPKFHTSSQLIGFIALAYLIKGIYLIFLPGIYFKEKLYWVSIIEWIAAFVNIALTIYLVQKIGILGAAISTLATYLLLAILAYLVGQKYFRYQLNWKIVLSIILVATLAFYISNYISFNYTRLISWTLILFLVLLFLLYSKLILNTLDD